MTHCKHCNVQFDADMLPNGRRSRSRLCVECKRLRPIKQAIKQKATKAAKRHQFRAACRHCFCPLLLLRRDNGKEEGRRVCIRCSEPTPPKDEREAERKRKKAEQVKAWVAANKERVLAVRRAWVERNKDAIAKERRKLLIEDALLVQDATRSFYENRSDYRAKKEGARPRGKA